VRRVVHINLLLCSLVFFTTRAGAQEFRIRGHVFDSTRTYPMEAVSVQTSAGRGTQTDAAGYYEILVSEKDSIWFSYLGKPTVRFPVLKISDPNAFDISLHVTIPVLKEVKIRPTSYRLDSIRNRLDYAKVFNYRKPALRPTVTSSGVGFDLNELVNMLRFRRNRSMAAFQRRLIEQEQESHVSHRFNTTLVRRLTRLEGPALDSFMIIYRPAYLFAKTAGEYEFQKYIRDAGLRFLQGLPPEAARRE